MTETTRPIVLIGMMGSGKTHIGRLLAKALSVRFYDTDNLVEEKAGCSVSEIFRDFGEDKFREAEHNTVMDVLSKGFCVIATGGGAVTNPRSLVAIKHKARSVYLRATPETLWERVRENSSRPLLQKENPRQILADLLDVRAPLYEQADICIDIDGLHEQDILHKILLAFDLKASEN